MDTIRIEKKNVQMIAHRGLSGIERENTCSAFVAAANRSYTGIETDIHVTKDGRFIVIHDENTARVSGDSIEVEASLFETLRGIQLMDTDGRKGRRDLLLPTLADYIGICRKYGKLAVLELKNRMTKEQIAQAVEEIRSLEYLEGVQLISFSLENLIDLRSLLPEQPAQYLVWKKWDDGIYDALKEYRLGLDADQRILTEEIVGRVHALGQKVNCWTVNTKEDGERMVAFGVDQITTNILE